MAIRGESAEVSWPCRGLDTLAWAWCQASDSWLVLTEILNLFLFIRLFFSLFQAPDSSHWRFTRENQNMETEWRLDNPVSTWGGILSCHSEWCADRITRNILYTCMLWPIGRQAMSKTHARDHAWGSNCVARTSPGSAQFRSTWVWKFSFFSRDFKRGK